MHKIAKQMLNFHCLFILGLVFEAPEGSHEIHVDMKGPQRGFQVVPGLLSRPGETWPCGCEDPEAARVAFCFACFLLVSEKRKILDCCLEMFRLKLYLDVLGDF